MRITQIKTIVFFSIWFIISVCSFAFAGIGEDFQQLVDSDPGLSASEKKAWQEMVQQEFATISPSFACGRLVFGILSQAKCDEVSLPKAVKVACESVLAVEQGAEEDIVSDLCVFAFSVDLTSDEIYQYATILKAGKQAGIPIPITQEMIYHAKSNHWPAATLTAVMSGLQESAEYDVDLKKIALFMMISVDQQLGSSEQIVADAIADSKKREPDQWKHKKATPEQKNDTIDPPPQPSIALDYDTFKQSVTIYLGTPYVWGGTTKSGVDCSGFTKLVMQENGYQIPRVSRDQAKVGDAVEKGNLKLGDLVFFDTQRAGRITHVGLYLGGNLLAHASSTKGVTIVLFSGPYFQSRYVCSRRIVKYITQ